MNQYTFSSLKVLSRCYLGLFRLLTILFNNTVVQYLQLMPPQDYMQGSSYFKKNKIKIVKAPVFLWGISSGSEIVTT